MTRVNLISPICLYDHHLLAEYREIPRIPNAVRKLLENKGSFDILKGIPSDYVLGTGHVKFFYDKLQFIKKRHDSLKAEGLARNMNLSLITINLDGIPDFFKKDFVPSEKNVMLNILRIQERIQEKPNFYKYNKLKII
jgi:deoxyribonuclease (pyrimidine dimer)